MKIALVGSSGGHLTQMLILDSWWKQHDRFWVTFNKVDASTALLSEKTYWCHFPTNRSIINLARNTFLAFRVILKERPDVIFSTGAAVAVPFFYIGKAFGATTVFLEVYDRIESPTLTGRLCQPVTDLFLVQWEQQKKFYKNAIVVGALL